MNRLVNRLQWSREGNRFFLVGYLPAGFPDQAGFADAMGRAFDGGLDALEVGLPNPPLPLDGPFIQEAVLRAARQVGSPHEALRNAAAARTHDGQALIALAYRHVFDSMGGDALIDECVSSEIDAVLMPEHSVAEQIAFAHRARARGLEQVIFVHLENDLPALVASGLTNPVIYLQSAELKTGGKFDGAKARERLSELREALGSMDAFVIVGFGIRGPSEISELFDSSADGAIIGTAFVQAAADGTGSVEELIRNAQTALPRAMTARSSNG